MNVADNDWNQRLAAFAHVRRATERHDELPSAVLTGGFVFEGERIPLVNPQRGIFKPRRMKHLLSIRTVFPKPGGRVWYDDQRDVHRQIYEGQETVDYAFMGTDPTVAENRWLKEAMDAQVPVIYFLGVSPGRYQAIMPAFIVAWDPGTAKASVAFSDEAVLQKEVAVLGVSERPPSTSWERRYALRVVQQRLHQATFRAAVIAAYRGRCALSGLPEPLLLDAAHIVADKDEQLGQPVVSNGLPLSKIHHAAFDAHLIGIDADFRVHVSERLLVQNDGPMLESLKRLHHSTLHLPQRIADRPARDRLAARFDAFKAAV